MPILNYKGKKIPISNPSENLLKVLRDEKITLMAPCGGLGKCKKCIVEINGKEKLACKAEVGLDDFHLTIPERSLNKLDYEIFEENTDDLQEILDGLSKNPLSEKKFLKIPPSDPDDGLSDLDRLKKQLSLKANQELDVPLQILRKLADTIRKQDGLVAATIYQEDHKISLLNLESGHQQICNLVLAIDLGTTTISVALIDLGEGKVLSRFCAYNEQIDSGQDIISRINYAKNEQRLNELAFKAQNTINKIIKKMGIDRSKINMAYISGNTVMNHLLLGLKAEYIRLDPYTPTLLEMPSLRAYNLPEIDINPKAYLLFSQNVGSYVGGDITAGVLCTQLVAQSDQVVLFIDVGTNGELVLGNQEFIFTCACSAGPAFEGGGVEFGMPATTGAIDKIELDPLTAKSHFETVGGGKPQGICGSAMIDLLAQLFKNGLIDSLGKLKRDLKNEYIEIVGKKALFVIADKQQSKFNQKITISEIDIENIVRAKAAIYSAITLILKYACMDFKDISKVYIAGGFGKYLNIAMAQSIGLFPNIPSNKFHYLGNSSLMGSAMVLFSREMHSLQGKIAKQMTYINLSNEPSYMEEYTAALFIPHTDYKKFKQI